MKSIEEIEALRPDQRSLNEIKLLTVWRQVQRDLEASFIGHDTGKTAVERLVGMRVPNDGTITHAEIDEFDPKVVNCRVSYPLNRINFTLKVV